MIWLLWPLVSTAIAQTEISDIQEFAKKLPQEKAPEVEKKAKLSPIDLNREITIDEIAASGTQLGAINAGAIALDLETNKKFSIGRFMYVRFFNLQDEQGFRYIQNKDGKIKWRILSEEIVQIKEELVLYEQPTRLTSIETNVPFHEFDKKLTIRPEFSFYAGMVQGGYMKDLFNSDSAKNGTSLQYGLHAFTDWKLPIKAGAVFHYEKATYNLGSGSQILYSSPSFGPQFKSKEFEVFEHPIRFQTQFRFGPFARASVDDANFKFNSADLLISIERPIKNHFGEFVFGLYSQTQWLSLKDQSTPVSLNPSNATNRSIGLSFSQVIE